MLDIVRLSSQYAVRCMDDADVDALYDLFLQNEQYFRYCGRQPSRELILSDLHATPPGKPASSKYYVGFYAEDTLVAVMDLIDGYPSDDCAYIGFFMMNGQLQGRQIGSGIIREVCQFLKSAGFTAVRLGIDKGNPQSTHFWKKNGFHVIAEVDRDGWTALVAERALGE